MGDYNEWADLGDKQGPGVISGATGVSFPSFLRLILLSPQPATSYQAPSSQY